MWWLVACAAAPQAVEADTVESAAPAAAVEPPAHVEEPSPTTIAAAFPPPDGAVRVDGGAFGAWLLEQRVLAIDEPVRTFDGQLTYGHDARVIDLPLVPGDIQQCTDSAIRLRAEWQRSIGVSPSFHAESGDEIPWSRFDAGEQPYKIEGGRVAWRAGSSRAWDDYLTFVFNRINTLKYDLVDVEVPRPGDMIQRRGTGGGIGHIVVLLDVATTSEYTYVLVGEGFMPAQSFHVERGPYDGWFRYADGELSPVYGILSGGKLRRWKS